MRELNRRTAMTAVAAAAIMPTAALAVDGPDPVFAAIEKHRRLNAEYSALGFARDELEGRLPEEIHNSGSHPRISLYPERELTTTMTEEAGGDVNIFRAEYGATIAGKFYYATTAKEIEIAAGSIPKEHRAAWIADRRGELAREKVRIRKLQISSGYKEAKRREFAAANAEYGAAQKLLATAPATLAGVHALISYAVTSYNNDAASTLIPDGADAITLLETVAKAVAAHSI
jgi:hypothetical protein